MSDKIKDSPVLSAQQIMQTRPDNLHKGSKGSSLDISEMIDNSGCAMEYYKLEDCLGEHDRNWSKCQDVVKLLQQCNRRVAVDKLK